MEPVEDQLLEENRNSWDTAKTRDCLLCNMPFDSAWSGERICKRCKGSTVWRSGGMGGGSSAGRR